MKLRAQRFELAFRGFDRGRQLAALGLDARAFFGDLDHSRRT